MKNFIISLILSIDVNWSSITDPMGRLFFGGNYTAVDGTPLYTTGIFGDPTLAGLFLFFIFFILTLIAGLSILVGSVAIIPALFAIFEYIPDLRIVVGIFCGLIFGLALHRLVKR